MTTFLICIAVFWFLISVLGIRTNIRLIKKIKSQKNLLKTLCEITQHSLLMSLDIICDLQKEADKLQLENNELTSKIKLYEEQAETNK